MNYNEVVFFDLETSGIEPKEHEIVQIAAIDAMSGDTFSEFVKFNIKNASPEALRCNHYSEEKWEGALTQYDAFKKFQKFLLEHAKQVRIARTGKAFPIAVMVGHNIDRFDMQFLREWETRMSDRLCADYACYDTLQLARWVLQNRPDYKLESLARDFECQLGTAHDALSDVRTNMAVAAFLMREAKFELPVWARKILKQVGMNKRASKMDDIPF